MAAGPGRAGGRTELSPPPSSPRRVILLSGLFTIVFTLAFLALVTVSVVRSTFLRPSFYTGALDENEIHDRVYEELLADPELADVQERLLGSHAPIPPQLEVAVLRLVLPPERLRQGFDAVITEVVTYIRGDRDQLLGAVDVGTVLAEIKPVTTSFVEDKVAQLPPQALESFEAVLPRLREFAAVLARGDVPDSVPMTASLPEPAADAAQRILSVLGQGVSEGARREVTAALGAGDLRGAIEAAASEYASPEVEEDLSQLRASLDEGRRFEAVEALADAGGQRIGRVVDELDAVRAVARIFSPVVGYVASVLMVASLAAMALLHRSALRRAVLVCCSLVLASSLVVLWLWALIGWLAAGPLDEAVSSAEAGWGLPDSLRRMLANVRATMGADLSHAVRRLPVLLIGASLVVGSVALLGARRAGVLAVPARRRRAQALGAALALVATLAAVPILLPRLSRPSRPMACNGHPELCDRPFNQVAFPATHNSMSASDLNWLWPEHEHGISNQLEFGIRALLIDTHHWPSLAEGAASVPPERIAAVNRVLTAVDPGRPGTFLCHNLCQLGATPLVDAFVDVREFLEGNPHEVVTLFIQDAISPQETEGAMRASGLLRFTHVHRPGSSWPTLRSMIERNERLLVMAEEAGPPPSWYHQGFQLTQETPFKFGGPQEFTCAPNRGSTDSDLFLLNHWIERPIAASRVDATVVNSRDFLVRRARQCQAERGRMPNFVAVNFYAIGDLIGAVDVLNRVDPST